MALMPWAAALVRTDGSLVPVGAVLTLSVVPSAAAAVLSRRRTRAATAHRRTGPVVVFADPARPDAPPLAGAREEAKRIRAVFGDRVVLRSGADATRAELLRTAPGSWIVHLACHGHNDVMRFEAMRLLLSDGDLTLDELRAMPPLRTRLVTLSACQTGHSDLVRLSDDMIGLPATFLAGGAAAVLGTLWPVHDRATALLVARLYEELAGMIQRNEPDDVPLALNRAQSWLRSTSAYGDPAFWASFYVLGT
jgi:CHAT domain-containing protein